MTSFLNLTAARSKIGQAVKNLDKNKVVLTKSGKPIAVLINYDEFEELNKIRQKQKRKEILRALTEFNTQVPLNDTTKQWLIERGLDPDNLDGDQILELLYEED